MNAVSIQFSSFLVVGGLSTILQYIVLVAAVSFFGVNPVNGSLLGYAFGGGVNYYLNYKLTFKSDKPHINTTWKFVVIMAVGFSLNGYIMSILIFDVELHYIFAQLLATAVVLVWNFIANKFWTFSKV